MSKIENEIESPSISEVKALFTEIEKEPFGNVFSSIFKDHTEAKSWQVEKLSRQDGYEVHVLTIYGDTKEIEGVGIPIMALSLRHLEGWPGIVLSIFKGKNEKEKDEPTVFWCAFKNEVRVKWPEGVFRMSKKDYKYNQWLGEIRSKIKFAISQTQSDFNFLSS